MVTHRVPTEWVARHALAWMGHLGGRDGYGGVVKTAGFAHRPIFASASTAAILHQHLPLIIHDRARGEFLGMRTRIPTRATPPTPSETNTQPAPYEPARHVTTAHFTIRSGVHSCREHRLVACHSCGRRSAEQCCRLHHSDIRLRTTLASHVCPTHHMTACSRCPTVAACCRNGHHVCTKHHRRTCDACIAAPGPHIAKYPRSCCAYADPLDSHSYAPSDDSASSTDSADATSSGS